LPNSAEPRRHGLLAAFRYALAGLGTAWRTQRNVRIHAGVTAAVTVAGIVVRLDAIEWALTALAVALVLAAELLNTAIEAVVDLVSPDDHPLAKHAKDVAAAAVLVACAGAVGIGVCVTLLVLDR
jgi:diacylglycerol kinase